MKCGKCQGDVAYVLGDAEPTGGEIGQPRSEYRTYWLVCLDCGAKEKRMLPKPIPIPWMQEPLEWEPTPGGVGDATTE